jgi:hydrogenase maturation protease
MTKHPTSNVQHRTSNDFHYGRPLDVGCSMLDVGCSQVQPLILGVGNLLMGDEGVGIVAIQRLEQNGFANRAELVDGGTSGFHLLGLFRDRRHIILIDAATDGKPVGAVSLVHPRYASDFPPTLTAHDIGLKDLLESAALLGDLPEVDLITISIGDLGLMTMELSPAVAAALPQVETLVEECLPSVASARPC